MLHSPRLLLLLLLSCSAAERGGPHCIEVNGASIDHGAGAVILPIQNGEQVRWLGYTQAESFWEPSIEDVAQLDSVLRSELERGAQDPRSVDEYVTEQPEYRGYVSDRIHEVLALLSRYRRQYVGIVNSAGRKQILLNGFPGPGFEDSFEFPSWREEVVVVSDGGSRYWFVVYDVESATIVQFHCNGEA